MGHPSGLYWPRNAGHPPALFADSLAKRGRIQGDNAMGRVGQFMLSNTFSEAVDFYDTLHTASNAAPVYWGFLMNGWGQGIVPGGGPFRKGVVGTLQDKALEKVFVNLGKRNAANAAGAIGDLKLAYDLVAFGYAFSQCH
jgi:hypothetical protein